MSRGLLRGRPGGRRRQRSRSPEAMDAPRAKAYSALPFSAVMQFGWRTPLLIGALVMASGAAYFFMLNREVVQASGHSLQPDDPQVLELGSRIYAQNCAACHGAKGEGQPNWREYGSDGLLPAPPHDASGHTWHHPDEQLFAITKYGLAKLIGQPDYRTAMPIYDKVLSDDEILASLSWIKAQWPREVRKHHDDINAQYLQSKRE